MTEPLVVKSLISNEEYARLTRRTALLRGLIIVVFSVSGVLLFLRGIRHLEDGWPLWNGDPLHSALDNLLLGIGFVVGPARFLSKYRQLHQKYPMIGQTIEFRFYGERVAFQDGNEPKEFAWRDVRRIRVMQGVLIIFLHNHSIYFVHIRDLTPAEKEFIVTCYRRSRLA
jgi:hypothetical protein